MRLRPETALQVGRALVPLLAAVAVLAGCGRSDLASVEDLERSVVATRDRVDVALARITTARSEDELVERMDDAASTIADSARDLDGVGAPRTYELPVENLVESLYQLAFDVEATADQIRQPGFDDLLAGARGLSFESWDRVNRSLARLSKKGIGVTPLERH